MTTLASKPFLGLPLTTATTAQFMEALLEAASARREPMTVAYLNAATVNLAFDAPDYARLMARMDCLYADGQAVVWAARRHGVAVSERINAGDFTREFIQEIARRELKLALVGGRPARMNGDSEAERAAGVFRGWAPALKIVFTHHGFFNDAERVRCGLEQADPDIVLLGMGSPRQERWALEWAAQGRPRVWWSVGALLEYYSGARARAPVWMRRAGLEWVFRLVLEPGRLWRRYLVGNPLFVWRALRGRPPKGLGELKAITNSQQSTKGEDHG